MTWGAVIGGVVSVGTSMYSANAQKGAANRAALAGGAKNTNGPFGSVNYDSGTANYDLGPNGDQFSSLAQSLGLSTLGNYSANPYDALTPDIKGGYSNAMDVLRGTGDQQNTNASGLFSALQGLGNDPTAIGNNMYHMLSAQAAPGQSQMFNGLQNKLFAQGRLGSSGGGNEFKGFFDSANNADIGRQIAGAQFGQGWQKQLQDQYGNATNAAQGTAMARYGLASDLLKTGNNANASTIGNASGLQGLFNSMFQPLFQSQGLGIDAGKAGQYGADKQYDAAQNQTNAITDSIGSIVNAYQKK